MQNIHSTSTSGGAVGDPEIGFIDDCAVLMTNMLKEALGRSRWPTKGFLPLRGLMQSFCTFI